MNIRKERTYKIIAKDEFGGFLTRTFQVPCGIKARQDKIADKEGMRLIRQWLKDTYIKDEGMTIDVEYVLKDENNKWADCICFDIDAMS